MEKSYEFNRDVLLAHMEQWQDRQRRDRRPHSDRALAEHVGVSHTYIQNIRRGHDGKRPTKRMNYSTGLKFRGALDIPRLEFLLHLPKVIDDRSTKDLTAA